MGGKKEKEKAIKEEIEKAIKEEKEKAERDKISFGNDVNDLLLKMRAVPVSAKVKEVFLWELVLNANFALYQVRFESLVEASKHGAEPKLFIHIVPDRSKGTLSIIDSGIGMNRDDLVRKFRTIDPKMNLEKYLETIDKYSKPDADDVDLSCIYSEEWQFGLGFFSAYMVANKVVITTKQIGDRQYVWQFEANDDSDLNGGSFTIDEDTSGDTLPLDRGTKVTLHLKKDHLEFLEEHKLWELVSKYSKYICPSPISISVLDENKNPIEKQIVDDDDNKENKDQSSINTLKEQFEGLRKLFVKFLKYKVKNIVISDRVYELTCNLSLDRKTLEINPRHPMMEELKADAEANPNDKEVKCMILLQFEACLNNLLLYDRKYGTSFYQRVKKHAMTQWRI